MKQNSQWLSQVRTWSNRADCTSTPRGSPASLSTATSSVQPAPPHVELELGLVGQQLVLDDVAGGLAVRWRRSRRRAAGRPGRPATRARRRRHGAATCRSRIRASAPLVRVRYACGRRVARRRRSCWPRRGASAPAWRWRSRPWPGWCGSSSRPCTATTRSSTTSWSSTASATSAWCSSTTSPRCPTGRR